MSAKKHLFQMIAVLIAAIALSACAPQAAGPSPAESLPAATATTTAAAATATTAPAVATATGVPPTAAAPTPEASDPPSPTPHPLAGETAWIAFQRGDSSDRIGVWLVHPDGSDEHQILTDVPVEVQYPYWSPDGARLIVTSHGDKDRTYEYDLATNTSRQLFECEDPCLGNDEATYSPDGTQVAFIRAFGPFVHSDAIGDLVPSDCGLWIGDLATGEVRQSTSNTDPPCDREYSPYWSPDGTQFVYNRDPYENGQPLGTSVYLMNVDGTNERRLTNPGLVAEDGSWSPDGEWVVFATSPLSEDEDAAEPSNLYRIRPDGSEMEQLTFFETSDVQPVLPNYTPDGEWILFTVFTPADRSLWAIPAEGGEPFVVLKGRGTGSNYTFGVWQPQP